jgi:hypothetical protein
VKPLWLNSVTGLYQELYWPDTRAISINKHKIKDSFLDSNIIFWSMLLQRPQISKIVSVLEDNIHNPIHSIPQFLGIKANKQKFINDILNYKVSVCDQGIDSKQFFKRLESLAILCELYSRFEFEPFSIKIHSGFILDESSAKVIVRSCNNKARNPYLNFTNEVIVPMVAEFNPDVLFLSGRIGYFFIGLATKMKKIKPELHICITRHSSEYFSLNKITKYLMRNNHLFEVIDSIAMEYFDDTEQILLDSIKATGGAIGVPNLLTRDHHKGCWQQDFTKRTIQLPPIINRRNKQVSDLNISPDKVYDVHLEPNTKCYWDKCVFCGINKKYTTKSSSANICSTIQSLDTLISKIPSNAYVWFIDEAIHPRKLKLISDRFLESNKTYYWKARCRINKDLLKNNLPEKLANAGMRELRLGLESASIRILELMHKYDDGFELQLVKDLAESYSCNGISIHFPIIIGFPGEETADRQRTYEFLSELKEKVPLISFNINIFNFDISSKLFSTWDNYSISNISLPCLPDEFIGNIENWDGENKPAEALLERERNNYMRKQLYPWMPPKALVPPTIYYRLSETIRNTLIWSSLRRSDHFIRFSFELIVQKSDSLTFSVKKNKQYLAYNWETHHYVEGDEWMPKVIDEWLEPKSIKQGIDNLVSQMEGISEDDIAVYVKKLLSDGHLLVVGNS